MRRRRGSRPFPELAGSCLHHRITLGVPAAAQLACLIEEPAKPLGGARRYTNGAVERVRFIKRAQQLGFSLNEIRRLLALGEAQSCGSARSLAEEKLGLVKARIADLERMRRALEDLIARCEVRRGKIACPIIATLSGEASLP
jgi:MerR family transcriptional regulator, mercuric resistance operon regulatory protein